ncbi:MAG: hypothetical protein JXR67_11205 [Bacteroidales bacterium]|nr:hypothetical protein [Deltaproteobacteria bacterium]MBN2667071.1 hypothetical protein [Bacteroidales bacterium]
MNSPQNKRKELEHILSKGNFVKINEAIKRLREDSPFGGAIGLLASHYESTSNQQVKDLIREFLNDLKDQSSCAEVVEEIRKDFTPATLNMLITSCWQSGLNYSGYMSDFAELFVSGDYTTAIECFTVIESSSGLLNTDEKDSLIKLIKGNASKVAVEKTALAMELLYFLEQTD